MPANFAVFYIKEKSNKIDNFKLNKLANQFLSAREQPE